MMRHKKIFLIIIAAYFLFSAIFHFMRLAFDWGIVVGEEIIVPTWVSALCILFSIFIVYWIIKIRDEEEKIDVEVVEE